MTRTKTRPLHVLVTEADHERLRRAAFQQRVSMAALVNRAIAHLLTAFDQEHPATDR